MKKRYNWILMISALALFSAHRTGFHGSDGPEYSRDPAAIQTTPARALTTKPKKSKSGPLFSFKNRRPD